MSMDDLVTIKAHRDYLGGCGEGRGVGRERESSREGEYLEGIHGGKQRGLITLRKKYAHTQMIQILVKGKMTQPIDLTGSYKDAT